MVKKRKKKPEKPESKQVKRDEGGKFIKGVSGNPLGKPKGIQNKKTIEKKIVEDEFKNRILLNIQELLTAQINIAKGASYLYRIEKTKDGKEKKHILVTDPEEIKEVLDECEGEGILDENYYYITTKTPDNRALDSLIDRVFGKPRQPIDLEAQIEEKQIRELVLTTRKILEIHVSKQKDLGVGQKQIQKRQGRALSANSGTERDI